MKSFTSLLVILFLLLGGIEQIYCSSNFRRASSRSYRDRSSGGNKKDEDTNTASVATSSFREKDQNNGALKVVGSLGLVVSLGVGLYYGINKLIKYINDKKANDANKLSPYIDTTKLLEGVISVSTGTPTTIEDTYVCLIFDCDAKLQEMKDKKARGDYFSLMANITSNVEKGGNKMTTVYIPGKGNGNIIDDNVSLKKSMNHWKYFNSKTGDAASVALRKKFSIRPEELRIVILDSKGKIVSDNALDLLRIDPRGMPWPQRSLLDIIGNSFLSSAGGALTDIDIKGKTLGLYFSASWCKPCQTFSPKLANAYDIMKGRKSTNVTTSSDDLKSEEEESEETGENVGKNAEIVFVSLDQEEEAFDEYRTKMPWPAIPFRDVRRAILQLGLNVKSIPALVFIDSEGRILTSSGVTELLTDEPLAKFPWSDSNVDLSSGSMVEKLQRSSAVVALTENCDDATKLALQQTMKKLADEFNNPVMVPRSPRDGELLFCVLEKEGKLSEIIRKLCLLPKTNPKKNVPELILLDFINEEYALGPILNINDSTDFASLSTSRVRDFAETYRKYNVEMNPFAKLAGQE